MKKIMYRWYYKEDDKTTISGVVLAKTLDEAIKRTKEYLKHQFDDINGKMNFITLKDAKEYNSVTLWVWKADTDDDYNDDFPDCLAVAH